jgi:hypothetical protein
VYQKKSGVVFRTFQIILLCCQRFPKNSGNTFEIFFNHSSRDSKKKSEKVCKHGEEYVFNPDGTVGQAMPPGGISVYVITAAYPFPQSPAGQPA